MTGNAAMGMDVRVAIDDADVKMMMRRIHARGKSLPLRKIGIIGDASIKRNFRESGRPVPWKGIEHREGKPLLDTTNLLTSINYKIIGNYNVEVGTDLKYGKWHQGGTRYITPRPFAMWQPVDIIKIRNVLQNHLTGGAGI